MEHIIELPLCGFVLPRNKGVCARTACTYHQKHKHPAAVPGTHIYIYKNLPVISCSYASIFFHNFYININIIYTFAPVSSNSPNTFIYFFYVVFQLFFPTPLLSLTLHTSSAPDQSAPESAPDKSAPHTKQLAPGTLSAHFPSHKLNRIFQHPI